MRIKHLTKLIYDEAESYNLNNTMVVIDGINLFFNTYKDSGLLSMFGCESDKYAQYLRRYLTMFKDANVKCYFFLKGGHANSHSMCKSFKKELHKQIQIGTTPIINRDSHILPILVHSVYRQVLEDMDFDYVICQFESKRECIAFAQKHQCPIISNDVEFCFSGVPYIPLNDKTRKLEKLFILDNFMRKFGLNEEKLAIFVVLSDEFKFPENHFQAFLLANRIPLFPQYKRYLRIFNWLKRFDSETALKQIFKYVTSEDRKTFLEHYKEVNGFIRRQEEPGLPSQYLEDPNNFQFEENDPRWFEKGVVTNAIAVPYVNLFRWGIAHKHASDEMLLSLDIEEYVFSLLCNFSKSEFKYMRKTDEGVLEEVLVEISKNFRKPNYSCIESPFENGWSAVRSLGLFEHFVTETLQIFNFTTLETLPEDARLLFVALVYFSRKKAENTFNEVYSVLLSYVVLNVLSEVECTGPVHIGSANYPILDASTNKDLIEHQDKLVAKQMLAEYLTGDFPENEARCIMDRERLYPILEFVYCLDSLNLLNRLCGKPYQPTVYSKTFNGTLVYRILCSSMNEGVDTSKLIENKLNQAPTVLAFWNGLIGVYEELKKEALLGML